MITNFLLLLIPLAAALGWYGAKRHHVSSVANNEKQFPRDYLIGLNYLLNEQPDKAVDIFIKMLEVDSETVETHLALGILFRRRGEVGRAIRIHQNLIARPQLSKQLRTEALLALGQDYLRAGLLDRAERLFLETADAGGDVATIALRHLLDIYQQQKRWESTIAIAEKLLANGDEVQSRIAQYYCEQAQAAYKQSQMAQAETYLQQALKSDPHCARASLLQGKMAMQAGQFEMAIRAYQKVREQDVDFLTEAIDPLVTCYTHLNAEADLEDFLQSSLKVSPRISFVLARADQLQRCAGSDAVEHYIAEQLHKRPSLRGLQRLLSLHLQKAEGVARDNLLILQELISGLLKNKPIYRCVQCGFGGKVLHWLCPSCKNWSSIKPIQGLEGE